MLTSGEQLVLQLKLEAERRAKLTENQTDRLNALAAYVRNFRTKIDKTVNPEVQEFCTNILAFTILIENDE